MPRRARFLLLAVLALTLSACQSPQGASSPSTPVDSLSPAPAQPAASGSPAASALPSVSSDSPFVTHWDSLTQPDRTVLSRRLSDGPLPEFVPAEGYGSIIPYIGSELTVRTGEESYDYSYQTPLYGLCTTDGLILTDPVFTGVSIPSWYDLGTWQSTRLPMWLLTRTAQDADGTYYTSVGIAALDGSWYTGQIFRGSETACVAATPAGLLMALDRETTVMIGSDGTELFRWTLDDLFPPDSELRSNDYLYWTLHCYGSRLYFNPRDIAPDSTDTARWIDPWTGQTIDDPSLGVPITTADPAMTYYNGGWYRIDGDTLEIFYKQGGGATLPYNEARYGSISCLGRSHIVYSEFDPSDRVNHYTLTDHQGNVICTENSGGYICLLTDPFTDESYPYLSRYSEDSEDLISLLGPDGTPILTACGWLDIYNSVASYCDQTAYCLTDLSGSPTSLIRLPRWSALDIPADE